MANALNKEKGYTEARNTANILKLQSHFINDINSTEVQTVDDLRKVTQVLQEVGKAIHKKGELSEF